MASNNHARVRPVDGAEGVAGGKVGEGTRIDERRVGMGLNVEQQERGACGYRRGFHMGYRRSPTGGAWNPAFGSRNNMTSDVEPKVYGNADAVARRSSDVIVDYIRVDVGVCCPFQL